MRYATARSITSLVATCAAFALGMLPPFSAPAQDTGFGASDGDPVVREISDDVYTAEEGSDPEYDTWQGDPEIREVPDDFYIPSGIFLGPELADADDFAAECGVRVNAPNYLVGTLEGDLVIDERVDFEIYKCVTWVKGNLTIDPDFSTGGEGTADGTCTNTPCQREGLAMLPWLHAVSGHVDLIGRYARAEVRLPRLYYVGGEIFASGEAGQTLWRSRSLEAHDGTLRASSRYGVHLRGFDDLLELGRLEIHAPDSADPNTQFISLWKGLASLEVVGSLDIDVDEASAANGFLQSLDEVEGAAIIDVEQALFGLDNLRSVGGVLDIYLHDTWGVGYATGLESLEEVGGDFLWDDGGSSLYSLTGLSSLTIVGGDFEPPLAVASLTGLENLTEVGGDLTLTGTIGWGQNLAPLASLETVGGKLTVENFAVSSLNGLYNLQSVGSLRIHDNPTLSSVSALYGMTVLGNGYVEITDNTPLTTCSANSLVSQIQATNWNGAHDTSGNESCSIYSGPIDFGMRKN